MANSKYEYVRNFEQPDNLLPNTWIVVRIDGRGFHKFVTLKGRTTLYPEKDTHAIDLMNAAGMGVMKELPDLVVAYGVSDEYSFVFHKDCILFDRRAQKLVTTIASTFTAHFIVEWPSHFPDKPLSMPLPNFDGRAVCYPSAQNLRDYMSWRQVDCHINNLYNTTFWTMIQQGGMDATEAEQTLQGTYSADKNEILFSKYGINYNKEPEVFKKGSVVFRDYERVHDGLSMSSERSTEAGEEGHGHTPAAVSKTAADKERKIKAKAKVVLEHVDIIKNDFWDQRPWILTGRPGKLPKGG